MSASEDLDPRVHPTRGDIAADFLEGRVTAETFVAGSERRVVAASAPVMTKPGPGELQASELLFGEAFTVYEDKSGWSWGQCGHDGYVGYVRSERLSGDRPAPTHWVTAARSLVFPDPKGEYPAAMSLGPMARVTVAETGGDFWRLATGGWIFSKHLAGLGETEPDFVATAKRYLGQPYLWGGRGGLGIDCSGLIQVPLAAAGIQVPRDTDQQAAAVGGEVEVPDDLSRLKPGDIVFFPGHVGIYLGGGGGGEFLHASSHSMMVSVHPLADVLARMLDRHGKGITAVRRVERGES